MFSQPVRIRQDGHKVDLKFGLVHLFMCDVQIAACERTQGIACWESILWRFSSTFNYSRRCRKHCKKWMCQTNKVKCAEKYTALFELMWNCRTELWLHSSLSMYMFGELSRLWEFVAVYMWNLVSETPIKTSPYAFIKNTGHTVGANKCFKGDLMSLLNFF